MKPERNEEKALGLWTNKLNTSKRALSR